MFVAFLISGLFNQGILRHYFSTLMSRLITSFLIYFHSIVQQALLWLHSFLFSGSILLSFLKESVVAPKTVLQMLLTLYFSLCLLYPPDGTFALSRALMACC